MWLAGLFFQVCFAKFADISQVSIAKFTDGTAEEREQQVQKLRNAFETQGMVVLMDTGFPEDVVEKTIQRSRDFFALPRAAKEHFFEPPGYPPRSYGAVTTPRGKHYMLQQSDDSGNILNEWLLVRNTTVQSDMKDPYYSSDEGREFFSSESKHPEQQEWPDQVPGLQEATAAYYVQVQKLANTMYRLFALAMGEQEDFFISRAKRAPIWPVTIAHYPPQLKDPGERKARIQPHWDRTLFALITTSDRGDEESNGGLQILVDKETGEGVDGRAEVEGRATEWQSVVRPAGGFVVNCGEMMSRWSNGRLKHVVHRVQNPVPGHADADRISLMAYVLPDYDAVVECEHCKRDGSKPLYDKTWVGEMMNWASKLPIYNKTKQDLMRMAQGLYTRSGSQTKLGEPTDVKSLEQALQAPISILDIGPLHNGTWEEKQSLAQQLSRSFERSGFAVVTGHGIPPQHVESLRSAAYDFFRSPMEEKKKYDKGKGYGFGGYNNRRENGAQLLGDFSRPNDLVESLHAGLANLRSGVEAVQLAKGAADAADAHGRCNAKDVSGCEMEESTPEVISRPAAAFLHSAEHLAHLAGRALQLSQGVQDEELDLVIDPMGGGLRLAFYPFGGEEPSEGQMGYGAHIDSGGITVVSLDPSNTGGLQVDISGIGTTGEEEDRHWVDVPFVRDSLVLNVGALLSRWTGGKWKASVHRVVAGQAKDRLSIITGALSPKVDGPAFRGFTGLADHLAPVSAAEYLGTRVELHRPEYAEEKGLSMESLTQESERIRQLQI